MKTRRTPRAITIAGALAALSLAAPSHAGPLDPPAGPVAPTHKTLTEVEPRIAVSAANTPGDATHSFRILQPGSYYLTETLAGEPGKHGILISAHGVTLDLNGFTVHGVPGSLDGITMSSFRECVVIRGGHVRGWDGAGISARIDTGRIEHITAARNGGWGISNASSSTFSTTISCCRAQDNGDIVADTGGFRGGQVSVITACTSFGNTGDGILTGAASRVADCLVAHNTMDGIAVGQGSAVLDCVVYTNTGSGITAPSDTTIRGNQCDGNGGLANTANIRVTGSDTRIEANNCSDGQRGIEVTVSGSIIIRNTCSANGVNWVIAPGNALAPIVAATTNPTAVSGSTYAGNLGSTDPNANFSY